MFEQSIHKVFMPHSLGHFIGFRVHDVGYHKYEGLSIKDKFQALPQYVLIEGMTVTVEPGIYFIDKLLNSTRNSIKAKYLNFPLIQEYQ